MDMLKQRQWTDAELLAAGFHRYQRRKTVVLARELPPHEAPKTIRVELDTLVVPAGYILCYEVNGGKPKASIDDYPQRPVDPIIFRKTYCPWNDAWTPTPVQRHLLEMGCAPFYKSVGAWAKQLDAPQWIQSLESLEPVLVPAGAWVLIGVDGEPYSTTDEEFRKRYQTAAEEFAPAQG